MADEIRENSEQEKGINDYVSFYDTLKMVKPVTGSQYKAEGELQMYIKKQVIETWEKFIYWLSLYLEEVRKGGGTLGHKVGSIRNQQTGLHYLFKKS